MEGVQAHYVGEGYSVPMNQYNECIFNHSRGDPHGLCKFGHFRITAYQRQL